MAAKRFTGKVVIITGSSGGMGEGIAKAYAAEGANVVLTGRNAKKLETVAADIKKLGAKVVYTAGDITSDVLRKKLVQNTLSEFGKIDILINNAGMTEKATSILEPGGEAFDNILNINLRSVYQLCELTAQEIVKTKGSIVNISSTAGRRPVAGHTAYCVAKAGIDMLSRCLAAELASHGVRVNGINPGAFNTDFLRYISTDKEKQAELLRNIGKNNPLGRVGEVDEIAKLVLFLTSEDAAFITGINAPLEGGNLLLTGS